MSMSNVSKNRMESYVSLSDFSPLEVVSGNVSVRGVIPGDVLVLGNNGEKNSGGSNEVFQEEISPELTEEILSKDSQRMKGTALR